MMSMATYRKQHYLPAVYLQNFASDQGKPSRRSRIWRFNGLKQTHVSVESQCFENYGYSRSNPSGAESVFHGMEGMYGDCMKKIRAGLTGTKREYFGLILMMFDLHLRNAAYKNLTGLEGIEAYRIRLGCFKREILLEDRKEEPSD